MKRSCIWSYALDFEPMFLKDRAKRRSSKYFQIHKTDITRTDSILLQFRVEVFASGGALPFRSLISKHDKKNTYICTYTYLYLSIVPATWHHSISFNNLAKNLITSYTWISFPLVWMLGHRIWRSNPPELI